MAYSMLRVPSNTLETRCLQYIYGILMALSRQAVTSGMLNGILGVALVLSRVRINTFRDGHQYTGLEDICGWMTSATPIPIGVLYLMLVIMPPHGESSSSILHSQDSSPCSKASAKDYQTGGSYRHGNISWIGD